MRNFFLLTFAVFKILLGTSAFTFCLATQCEITRETCWTSCDEAHKQCLHTLGPVGVGIMDLECPSNEVGKCQSDCDTTAQACGYVP